MSPSAPMDDLLDRELGNRIFSGKLHSGNALGESCSDFEHLFFGKNRTGVVFPSSVLSVPSKLSAENARCMESVFAWCDDLKIFNPIVILCPVLVVDHFAARYGADEELVNESMDFESLNQRCSGSQTQDIVSVFVYTAAYDFSAPTDNASKAGDLITIPIRDVRPFFDLFHTGEDTTGFSHMARPIIPH